MMVFRTTIFLLLAFANFAVSNSNVPVLIWNTHQPEDVSVPAVSALQQISVASLQARYFDSFRPNNVLLFLQDALSIEDLSSHSAELTHVNGYMESGHSLYLPNVIQPAQLQHDLVQQGYKVTSLNARSAVAELKLEPSARNLVLVKLPPTLTNPSRSRAIQKADEVIQSVLSKIGDAADFTVIYTGIKPSLEAGSSDDVTHARVSRSLSQSEFIDTPKNFHQSKCILIYFRKNMTISLNGKEGPFSPIPESTTKNDTIDSCTDANMQSIQLNYDNVKIGDSIVYKLKITFNFKWVRGSWRSPTAEVTVSQSRSSSPETHKLQLIDYVDSSVPVGHSYSCSATIKYKEPLINGTTSSSSVQLRINGVQVQAFMPEGSTSFGPSWDCVGFFTIGIWSGLFATFIMLLILSYGMMMLANIKTMDRFDDPKGKSIMIPQTHE